MKSLLLLMLPVAALCQQIPTAEWQIKTALLAAPEDLREGATVLGYNAKGEVVTLRKGTNTLICLADDPTKEGFSVSAYHKDLEPYMARGRELRAQGKNFKETMEIREREFKEGKVTIPQGATLFVLSGKADPATGEVTEAYLRYVVYIPYATVESTGLPLNPSGPGGPWIMDPGTHRAHIMINPPKQ
jgi:hypothetical protein